MPRAYGKTPTKNWKRPDMPEATEIQVNITGRHTIEQLALEVQRALAMVQDYGATGMEKFRFRLLPLDEDATPMILRDAGGSQVTVINIPDVAVAPAYRQNEPGVGVSPLTNSLMPASQDASFPVAQHPKTYT